MNGLVRSGWGNWKKISRKSCGCERWNIWIFRRQSVCYEGGGCRDTPNATTFRSQPTSGPQRAWRVMTNDAEADCADDGSWNSSSVEPENPLHGPSTHSAPGKLSRSAFGIRNITNAEIRFPAKINKDAETMYTRRTVRLQPDITLGEGKWEMRHGDVEEKEWVEGGRWKEGASGWKWKGWGKEVAQVAMQI